MAVDLVCKLWTVEEYEEMIEKGILDKYDHVELIRGEIVEMAAIGVRHAGCVTNLEALFHELLDDEQPQAQPGAGLAPHLVVAREQVRQVGLGNARARVLHLDFGGSVPSPQPDGDAVVRAGCQP